MKKLVIMTIVFSELVLLGMGLGSSLQHVGGQSAPLELNRAFVSGGLEFEGLEYQYPAKDAQKGPVLSVVNNYGTQHTAPISQLEPKVSDVYYQYAPNKALAI